MCATAFAGGGNKAQQPFLAPSSLSTPGPDRSIAHPPTRSALRTDPLDEHEARDDEDRVPIELGRAPVPGEPLAVVEDPEQGEDDGEEAEQQRGREEGQEKFVAFHLPPHQDETLEDPNKIGNGAETGDGALGVARPPLSSPGGKKERKGCERKPSDSSHLDRAGESRGGREGSSGTFKTRLSVFSLSAASFDASFFPPRPRNQLNSKVCAPELLWLKNH